MTLCTEFMYIQFSSILTLWDNAKTSLQGGEKKSGMKWASGPLA